MEPANKPSLSLLAKARAKFGLTKKARKPSGKKALDFLPDADEIELRPLPPSVRITMYVLVAAFIVFILWAIFSNVDRDVATHGRLVTPLSNIIVQPLETSIIQSIDVRVGQVVKKGQKLASLDPTFTEADDTQLRTRLHSLDNQLEQMDAELSGKKIGTRTVSDDDSMLQSSLSGERHANFTAQVLKLQEAIAHSRATLETNSRDQKGLASRVKVLKEMESIEQNLVDQKYAVRSRLLDVQDRLIEAERSLEMSKNRQTEITRELAGMEAEKASFESGWRQKMMEELLTISRERDSVSEQLQKADKRSKLVELTSPIDAVVLDIAKLSQGSIAQGAEKLFTLVPLGAELEAEVQIDAMDVGYLKIGDKVHVKLDAFPYQKHGMLDGEIRTISEDAFHRDATATTGSESYYTGRVHLKSTQLKKMPEGGRLLPGMSLSAEIVVGKRSVMSYILWPMLKASDEAITEP